mmetsp:Transcript_49694/g.144148  ORF Transcript_49694/g.144148 Transcript_49694/m.144148 type:complete len:488 (-) Transcript_49694:129-1592(-)
MALLVAPVALMVLASLGVGSRAAASPTPSLRSGSHTKQDKEDVLRIGREAYVYGYPLAENYNTMYAFALDNSSAQYKAPLNVLKNEANLFTPEDTAVVTPNADTPYSLAWLDLRAEPVVLTVPPINESRYWSFQFVDWYTFNFAYIGTRTTGNSGGSFLIVGSNSTIVDPAWASRVFLPETPFILMVGRTQLFNSSDLENVKAIQAQYKLQTLSQYLGTSPPRPAPEIQWPRALGKEGNKGIEMFQIMDFMLSHLPVNRDEQTLRDRFMYLGIGSGQFNSSALSVEDRAKVKGGIAQADGKYKEYLEQLGTGKLSSGDLFGSREFLFRRSSPLPGFMARFVGARSGLYGNSRKEAMYFFYDGLNGTALNGSKHAYCLTMKPKDMRMAKAFWSLTMYDRKTQLLVNNPIGRYLVNSGMVPEMLQEPEGSVVIRISASMPDGAVMSNWLPAPNSTFFMVLRLYLPKRAVFAGQWRAPTLKINKTGMDSP